MADELDILVVHQKQELMAAKTLESDLELAFRIQMQEALTASSLLSQCSSSSSPSNSFNLTSDLDLKDESSNFVYMQTQELERFQQERRDREIFESEMRRIAYDLKRRAHDQNFAHEINGMPDEEWEKYGDNFERPINSGASSSAGPAIKEPFRVYFKGLVTNEQVNGRTALLAAIGIAVCDPRDILLLKIQKPMSGAGMSNIFIEAKALVEALHTAHSLGLRNIDVFCDYLTLFNQVSGIWTAKQKNVVNLIGQVHSFRTKFEKLNIQLLPRCRVKFAFKLAREAIDSQISRTIETVDNNLKETCTICLEDNDVSQIFVVDGCSHRYCCSCMKQHVEVKLLHGVLPGCPKDGCHTKLNVNSSKKFLSPRLVEIMTLRIMEASIPETDRVYCPYPKCSALMSRKEMVHPQEESSSTHQANHNSGLRKCTKCKGFFCINCKVPWHGNMSCYDYKKFNPYAFAEDAKLQSLAKKKLWRQCIKCKHMIELAEGCYHMTCRCGYEFCYTCGAEWKKKKPTCSCALWDEVNILHDDFSDDEDEEEYLHDQPRRRRLY